MAPSSQTRRDCQSSTFGGAFLRRWVDVENLARHREFNEQRVLREDVLLLVAHHGE